MSRLGTGGKNVSFQLCLWLAPPEKATRRLWGPGDLPDPGFETASLTSPALAGGFFTTGATWKALLKEACMHTCSLTSVMPDSLPPYRL